MKKDIKFLHLLLVFALMTGIVVYTIFPYLEKGVQADPYDRLSFGVPYLLIWFVIFAYYGIRKLFSKRNSI